MSNRTVHYINDEDKYFFDKTMNFHVHDIAQVDMYSYKELWWRCENNHLFLASPSFFEGQGFYCKICSTHEDGLMKYDIGTPESEISLDIDSGLFFSDNPRIKFCRLSFIPSIKNIQSDISEVFNMNEIRIPVDVILSRNNLEKNDIIGEFVWECLDCKSTYDAGLSRDMIYEYSNLYGLCYNCNKDYCIPGFNDIRFLHFYTHANIEWDILKYSGFDTEKNKKPMNLFHSYNEEQIYWKCYNGHQLINTAKDHLNTDECMICFVPINDFGNEDYWDKVNNLRNRWDKTNNIGINPYIERASYEGWWNCTKDSEHLIFKKSIDDMFKNPSCPYCEGKLILPGNNDISSIYPEIASLWQLDLNPEFDIRKNTAYGNRSRIITLKCDFGHILSKPLSQFIKKIFCVECQGGIPAGSSAIQIDFCREFEAYIPDIEGQKGDITTKIIWPRNNRKIKVDMISVLNSIIIEYDGEYFHSGKRSGKTMSEHIEIDVSKTLAMLNAGYKVIRIRENNLPYLKIEDVNLYQISHKNGSALQDTVKLIVTWLNLI